jgi:putative intracellular protease/amidase
MADQLKGKRVAALATHGFEQDELLGPRKALEDAGAKVDIVSPERGEFLERLAVECRNVIRPKAGTAAEASASWPPRTTCSATIPFARA